MGRREKRARKILRSAYQLGPRVADLEMQLDCERNTAASLLEQVEHLTQKLRIATDRVAALEHSVASEYKAGVALRKQAAKHVEEADNLRKAVTYLRKQVKASSGALEELEKLRRRISAKKRAKANAPKNREALGSMFRKD